MTRVTDHPRLLTAGAALLAALGLAALSGCRGDREDAPPRQFFPDMDDAPKWKPQSRSDFFADGRTMRQPVPGAVPYGRVAFVSQDEWAQPWMTQRQELLRDDRAVVTGTNADGSYVARIPIAVTPELITAGAQNFNIYCAACHGYEGDGQGMVGRQWAAPVPSYHSPQYSDPNVETGRDGYIFHVARNGVRTMPGYAHAVSEREAWGVVAYIRVLQQSRRGTISDIPEAQQPDLLRSRPLPPVPANAAPAGGTPAPASPPAPAPGGTPATPTAPTAPTGGAK